MKRIILLMALFTLALSVQCAMAETVSNSYGDPGDAYLTYTISGPDFSGDPDGPPVHIGTYTGEPIHLSGKMVVSRPEGLKSWVTMKASLGDQAVIWPEEGQDNTVENKKVELPFDFTFVVPEDYASDTVLGNVRLEACAGGCGVYNIDLRVSMEPIEIEPQEEVIPEKDNTYEEIAPIVEEPCVDSGARFSSISKVIDIFPDSNPDNLRSGNPHSVLCVNDHVLTGEESSAIITFADSSVIIMKAESEIVIGAPPREKGRLEILKGRLLMNIKKVIAGEPIEVKTNLVTMGIKGTTFALDVTETATTLKVIEGTVEFTSDITGEKELVSGAEAISATSAGLKEKTTFDIEAEKDNWQEAENFERKSGSILLPTIIVLLIIAGVGLFFVKKKKYFH